MRVYLTLYLEKITKLKKWKSGRKKRLTKGKDVKGVRV